jgi:hypothetical protein
VSGDDEVNVDDEDSTSSEEEIIEGTTRSGRSFKNLRSIDKPSRSSEHRGRKVRHSTRKEALLAQLPKRLTPAEVKFYNDMKDLKELSLYRDKYVEGIDEEQYKMSRNEVFEEVKVNDIPPGTKLLDSTWANKLKADGSTHCRLIMCILMPPAKQPLLYVMLQSDWC